MALGTGIGLGDLVGDTVGDDIVTHSEGMAASLEESRITQIDGLHVTADAKIAYCMPVGRAGNRLSVSDGVNAFNHVALRPIVRAKAGAPIPGGLTERIF